jgi:REP element-mobilizing transposase RayT
VKLTATGKIVKQHIEHINTFSESVELDNYVIMPNHIHLIISIKTGTPKAASPAKAVIPQIVNALKSLTSKKLGRPIWQRSYHDHIIRDETEYRKIWEYIDTNPQRWKNDKYYDRMENKKENN